MADILNAWLVQGKDGVDGGRITPVTTSFHDSFDPVFDPEGKYLYFLSNRDYNEVIGVYDPAQVLELARTYLPRVISLDVMMPKVDGWEILQALQADPLTHSIPVIICSAWEEPELARSLGAAAFLKKPVTQKDFVTALETIGLLAD